MGGPAPGSVLAGTCTTSVSRDGHRVRVDFTERSPNGPRVQAGGWTIQLVGDRVVSDHVHGWVPQLVP